MSKYSHLSRKIRARIVELIATEPRSAADIILTLSAEFQVTDDFATFRKEAQNMITYLKSSGEIHTLPDRISCPIAKHSVLFYLAGANPKHEIDPILIPRVVWSGYVPPAFMPAKASWLAALA